MNSLEIKNIIFGNRYSWLVIVKWWGTRNWMRGKELKSLSLTLTIFFSYAEILDLWQPILSSL